MLQGPNVLDSRVELFVRETVSDLTDRLTQLGSKIEPDAAATDPQLLAATLQLLRESVDICREFEQSVKGESDVIRQAQEAFRQETASVLQQSWIVERAQTKPTGFAGDCQMLNAIYEWNTPTTGFGAYLDAILLELPLGMAVRERIAMAKRFLIDELGRRRGDVSILDVASGPCREFQNWQWRPRNGDLYVTCLDNDTHALEYVERHVQPTAAAIKEMRLERYNAFRTKAGATNRRRFGRPTILYSVGLADYIPDRLITDMLAGWRETVSEDGIVYVAFKDGEAYDKTPYQWHLDWHFLQRTDQECRDLLTAAGFDGDQIQVVRDASGIILHYFCYMSEMPTLRLDAGARAARPPIGIGGQASRASGKVEETR